MRVVNQRQKKWTKGPFFLRQRKACGIVTGVTTQQRLVPVFFAPIKVKETAEEVKTTINPYGAGNRNPSAETRPRAVKPQGPSYREDDDQPNSSRGEKKTTRPSRLALQLLLFLLFH